MNCILTASGSQFDYADPHPEAIHIRDIAQALSRESRFNGHTRGGIYTVAQHCVWASWLTPTAPLEALLHDASEAYLKDIPSPLKALLPDYRRIEARVDAAIRQRYGLPAAMSPEVKEVDLIMLATERRDLMPMSPAPWPCLDGVRALGIRIHTWSPEEAEGAFRERARELGISEELI